MNCRILHGDKRTQYLSLALLVTRTHTHIHSTRYLHSAYRACHLSTNVLESIFCALFFKISSSVFIHPTLIFLVFTFDVMEYVCVFHTITFEKEKFVFNALVFRAV